MSGRTLILVLCLSVPPAHSGVWTVIGAGNATCSHWNEAGKEQRREILSWMTGFSSAENLSRAAEGRPELRIEYLTYDYLVAEIERVCSVNENAEEHMSGVLFGVLARLPSQPQ